MLEKKKNNPVKGGGQSKSCGFCKMSGHQLNKCWLLNTYGARLTAKECTDLAQLAFSVDSYATETLAPTRQNDTVFESIPNKTCCVVIHQRYAKTVSSTEINGHREFLFECTILAIGAKFVELRMVTSGGTTLKPLTKSLFTISAICQYAYSAGKSKHLISQLKRIYYSSTVGGELGDFGLPLCNISTERKEEMHTGDSNENECYDSSSGDDTKSFKEI